MSQGHARPDPRSLAPVKVRWGMKGDIAHILSIDARTFDPLFTRDQLQCLLRQPKTVPYVVTSRGQVLGYAIVTFENRAILVYRMAVHPTFRRRGLGAALIDHLVSKLDDQHNRVSMFVHERDLETQLFLRGVGVPAIRMTDVDGSGDQHIYFSLAIRSRSQDACSGVASRATDQCETPDWC